MIEAGTRAARPATAIAIADEKGEPSGPSLNGSPVSPEAISCVVRRVRSGDGEAFERLYKAFRPQVEGLVRRFIPVYAEVEDLTQEVFLKAFVQIGNLRDVERFKNWLMTIARNEALGSLRRRRLVMDGSLSPEESGAYCAPNQPKDDRLVGVERAWSTLSSPKRQLLVCMALGLSDGEISARLGKSLPSIKLQKHRLRRLLDEAAA